MACETDRLRACVSTSKSQNRHLHASPEQVQGENAVLKLIQNVHGLADASLTWHEHLKKGLIAYGFEQDQVDPCLFYKRQELFILFVDDAVCLTPNTVDADAIISRLERK
jgi:hypothetical protein